MLYSPYVTRRSSLQLGCLGVLGLSLTNLLRGRAYSANSIPAKAKRCILIWLDGGPSHLDTFDLKPDAPAEVRGPFQPIETSVPGVRISEFLPETARHAQHLAIIRSMTSPLGEHNFGSHYLLTGYQPTPVLQYPSYGAVLTQIRAQSGLLPANISIPNHNHEGGAGFLPSTCNPFAVGGDPARNDFKVRDLTFGNTLNETRLARREQFLRDFHRFSNDQAPADPLFEQAFRLVSSSESKQAFDITQESQETRSRYGNRTVGQSCLLARRLLEAGVPFVTVTDRGWDTHDNIFNRLKEGFTGGTVGKIPSLDLAYSALLNDLSERGMLGETLVVLMGEFGRTPKINTNGGRDHWPRVFSIVLAGGGVQGGQVIGASDTNGESPAARPVKPEDLAHTIYTLLGIDPGLELHTSDGRPVSVNKGGTLIQEVIT